MEHQELRLEPLTQDHLPLLLEWRRGIRPTLRTKHLLSLEEERRWLKSLQIPSPPVHYFALENSTGDVFAFTGLVNIDYSNKRAEVALLIGPDHRGKGSGKRAIELLREEAFTHLGLLVLWGECYTENQVGLKFWEALTKDYGGFGSMLSATHLVEGTRLSHSYHFTWLHPTIQKVVPHV